MTRPVCGCDERGTKCTGTTSEPELIVKAPGRPKTWVEGKLRAYMPRAGVLQKKERNEMTEHEGRRT